MIFTIFLSFNAAVKEVTQLPDCVYRQNARFFTLNDVLLLHSILLVFFSSSWVFCLLFYLLRRLFGVHVFAFFIKGQQCKGMGWLHVFILHKLKWIAWIFYSNEKSSELCAHSSQRALPVTAQLIFRFFALSLSLAFCFFCAVASVFVIFIRRLLCIAL